MLRQSQITCRGAESSLKWWFLSIAGGNMLRVNEYRLYDLGAKIHPLSEPIEGREYGDVLIAMWNARGALNGFINDALVPLKVCRPSAMRVMEAINTIVPSDVSQVLEIDKEMKITWVQSNALVEAVNSFETILSAEMQSLDTYFVSQKGAFSTYDLIEQAHIAIPEAMRDQLPIDAQYDFDQAGKCIAFDLATAAGFHLVRAAESVLRRYYKEVTGVMPKVKDRNWGAFIKILEKYPEASPKIIKLLKDLKDDYRNPILHPEITLTSAQALIMFTVFIGAAVSLLAATEDLAEKRQPSLPLAGFSGELAAHAGELALPPSTEGA